MNQQRSPMYLPHSLPQLLLLCGGLMLGSIAPGYAQSGCFLVNEYGETVNLDELCGYGQSAPELNTEVIPVPVPPDTTSETDLLPSPEDNPLTDPNKVADETQQPDDLANSPANPPESAQAPEQPEPIRRDRTRTSTETPQVDAREELYRGYQDIYRRSTLENKVLSREALVEAGY